jgi:hypothetical protein
LGQGVKAIGAENNFLNLEADARWPWITKGAQIPQLGSFNGGGVGIVKNLISVLAFDLQLGRVTREQIVDWVRSVEPAEEVAPVIESVPEAVCA